MRLRSLVLTLMTVAGTACVTPRPDDDRRVEPSFSATVSALPRACCPSCRVIELSVRNTGDTPLLVDWERSRFRYNSEDIRPLIADVDGRTRVAPRSTLNVALSPPPGAPNAASLEEGTFRNGTYRMALAVLEDGDVRVAKTELELQYAGETGASGDFESAECRLQRMGKGRPRSWPEQTASDGRADPLVD